MSEGDRTISLTTDDTRMPLVDVVTGRGFVTGKSGSGKSNTTSVLAEELLSENIPLLIVDTDGEYYGLKEQYEVLHVGGDDHCDVQVEPHHADKIAEVALTRRVPTILDVSGFVEPAESRALVYEVVRELFVLEKEEKMPFLLLVEEAHEFIPEQGGLDEVGEMLVRVAKRGRKRGLGITAISQRPASVDKDYITQCDWLVWHRLTWENDTQVVGKILGSEAAESVQTLDPGEAILLTDWDDTRRRVQFRRKNTYDAGATPGLEDQDRPELKTIDDELIADLKAATSMDPEADDADAEDDVGDEEDENEEPDADSETETQSTDTGATGSTAEILTGDADDARRRIESDGGGATATRSPAATADARSDDLEWEFAEFVAYIVSTITGAVASAAETIERGLSRLVARLSRFVASLREVDRPDPLATDADDADANDADADGRDLGVVVFAVVLALLSGFGLGLVLTALLA